MSVKDRPLFRRILEFDDLLDGELELELPAGSLFEARRFVLSFGREAIALSPASLVESLRAETEEMASAYGTPRR